jgi:hypothetical protein
LQVLALPRSLYPTIGQKTGKFWELTRRKTGFLLVKPHFFETRIILVQEFRKTQKLLDGMRINQFGFVNESQHESTPVNKCQRHQR